MTRQSTPKYEVVHDCGTVALTGVSKTEASQIARDMNKGASKKRFSVRPVKRLAIG
jgi:hypothetical protein